MIDISNRCSPHIEKRMGVPKSNQNIFRQNENMHYSAKPESTA